MEHGQKRRALTLAALILLFLVLGPVSTSKAEQYTYWYDDLNRLEALQIEPAGKVMLFDYDEVGNRTAREVQDGYLIGVTAGVHGSVSTGTTVVPSGGSQTFNITPSAGYRIADVVIDGISVGPVTSYTFANTTASHTLVASFVQRSGADNTIVWRNSATGENAFWHMDNATHIGGTLFETLPDVNWRIVGAGDFNGDGKPDLVWRNGATGENAFWYMDNTTHIGGTLFQTIEDANWRIVGVGDFNGDGKPDLVWRNGTTGENGIWYMDNATHVSSALFESLPDANWQIVGVGDFNGDGKPDLVWRNGATGENALWYMDNAAHIGGTLFETIADANWRIVGVSDFNGDGKPGLIWRNGATGENGIWYMDNATHVSSALFETLDITSWEIVGVGQFMQ